MPAIASLKGVKGVSAVPGVSILEEADLLLQRFGLNLLRSI